MSDTNQATRHNNALFTSERRKLIKTVLFPSQTQGMVSVRVFQNHEISTVLILAVGRRNSTKSCHQLFFLGVPGLWSPQLTPFLGYDIICLFMKYVWYVGVWSNSKICPLFPSPGSNPMISLWYPPNLQRTLCLDGAAVEKLDVLQITFNSESGGIQFSPLGCRGTGNEKIEAAEWYF